MTLGLSSLQLYSRQKKILVLPGKKCVGRTEYPNQPRNNLRSLKTWLQDVWAAFLSQLSPE